MSRVGFIGTGHIAAPMARFLADRGNRVVVSERNADVAGQLKASHSVEVTDNQSVLDVCDVIFLCLRPHVADETISALKFRAEHRIVSVIAGVSLGQLAALCAPACDITMTIPLGYLEQGGCPLPACPTGDALRPLFAPENPVLEVPDERAFNMHFAVCAFVPGVLDLMETASEWLGDQTADPDAAVDYTRLLVSGFLLSLRGNGRTVLPSARDALATEGTLSLQMIETLKDQGAHTAVVNALEAIGARLEGSA